jgi:predicted SAM-dependent methyltransferase
MDRRDRLLSGLDLQNHVGMEIGALCRPFLMRDEGQVLYVDHAETPALRHKYANDPDVNLDNLVEVDVVWGASTLKEALGDRRVDYIVASHVIEHVPDLIGWLHELSMVLAENGALRLIIPDKRFTFGYLRRETCLSDVLYSNVVHARYPQPHVVLDYVLNVTKVDCAKAWRDEIESDALEFHHSIEDAVGVTRDVIDHHTYHDVHCWVFTPLSFARLITELAQHGLIDFKCVWFHQTEIDQLEFMVAAQKCNDRGEIIDSWRSKVREMLLQGPNVTNAIDTRHRAVSTDSNDTDRLNTKLLTALSERDRAQRIADALLTSNSWKLTKPLRILKQVFARSN